MTKKFIKKEQEKAVTIDSIVKKLNDRYGQNCVMKGVPKSNDGTIRNFVRIPTGSFSLNCALNGGIPVGRYIEISGAFSSTKTSQAIHILRNAQEMGLSSLLIDYENTSDERFIRAFGVDVDELYYSRPDSAEEAFNIILEFQRTEKAKFCIIDSISALSPSRESENKGKIVDIGDSKQMGIFQVMLSEFLRRWNSMNNRFDRENKTPFTLLALNQLREKPGGMGDPEYCIYYYCKVKFTDGREIPIGEVVEKRIKGKVWSLNTDSGLFEEKEIEDWRYNGDIESDEEYLRIVTRGAGSKNGFYSVTATYDHQLWTSEGWKEAQNINVGDLLVSRLPLHITGILGDFMWGSFVGDSHIVEVHGNTACYRLRDNQNEQYRDWKLEKLQSLFPMKSWKYGLFSSFPSVELFRIKEELGKRDPLVFLERHFSKLGLAVWFMDDGSLHKDKTAVISIGRLSKSITKLGLVCTKFKELGYDCYLTSRGRIMFTAEGSKVLFGDICMFIPDFMQYKIAEEFRGKYVDFSLENKVLESFMYNPVMSVSVADVKKKGRYDIKVGEYHNFIAGGLVVHNTPGGRAKDFVSSLNIRFRSGDWITEGAGENKQIVGQVIKFKVAKNKTGRRMTTGSFNYYMAQNGAGVKQFYNDNVQEIIVEAIEKRLIRQKGAWYYSDSLDAKFNGLEALVEAIRYDTKFVDSLTKEIDEVMKLGDN